jgi:spermidine synthase
VTRPWTTLAKVETREGLLELRQRGEQDFLIVIGGRVLMNSYSRSSEEELARLALDASPRASKSPRVLIAGLGMGFTLRAALDRLPPDARVTVCEINTVVVEWCRGPLAVATRNALADRRVDLRLADVASVIANAPPGTFDAIILDLYEGPNAASQRRDDPFYSARALEEQRAALGNGVLAVWSEDADASYAKRLSNAGFAVKTHSIGSGGRRHIVYVATAAAQSAARTRDVSPPRGDTRRRRGSRGHRS